MLEQPRQNQRTPKKERKTLPVRHQHGVTINVDADTFQRNLGQMKSKFSP